MDCEHFRQAISARIDGEDPGIGPGILDRHVAGCGACRAWEATAVALTRSIRVRPAEDLPDLSTPIMTAIAADATATRRASAVRGHEAPAVIRSTLGLIAAAQVLIAIPALAGNDTGATLHVAHEAGAWSLALAAALAMAAWRPARAAALLPFLAVFVGSLAALTVGDIAAGRVAPSAELPHLMAGFGLLLLWLESHPPTGIGHPSRGAPARRGARVAA